MLIFSILTLNYMTPCSFLKLPIEFLIESDVNRTGHARFHPADGALGQMDWMFGCGTNVLCNDALYAALAKCWKCDSKQLLQELTDAQY